VAGFIAAQRVEHQVPYATACRALGVSQAVGVPSSTSGAMGTPRRGMRAVLN